MKLTCTFRKLLFRNYTVEPTILMPYLPKASELDLWKGKAWISLVGLIFENTKVSGISVPFFQHFPQVNLRLYVKNGVVVLRELVPKPFLSVFIRLFYREKYLALPLTVSETITSIEYRWRDGGVYNRFGAKTIGNWQTVEESSEEFFFTQRLYGFTPVKQVRIDHTPWRVKKLENGYLEISEGSAFPSPFLEILKHPPDSHWLAEGSEVTLMI